MPSKRVRAKALYSNVYYVGYYSERTKEIAFPDGGYIVVEHVLNISHDGRTPRYVVIDPTTITQVGN